MERNRGVGTERERVGMNRGVETEKEGWGRREGVGRGTERLRNSSSKTLFYKDCSQKPV